MATERWRRVVAHRTYWVSTLGRVWSEFSNRALKGSQSKGGYRSVKLNDRRYYVHHLVLRAFVGPRPRHKVVNHKDGDKSNNALANLEYLTPSDNGRHAARLGLLRPGRSPGEMNGAAKLTATDVVRIRELRSEGMSVKELADRFKVSRDNVRQIIARKTWRHIP